MLSGLLADICSSKVAFYHSAGAGNTLVFRTDASKEIAGCRAPPTGPTISCVTQLYTLHNTNSKRQLCDAAALEMLRDMH